MAKKAKTKFKEMKFKSIINVDECYKLTKYYPKYKNKLRLKLGLKYLIFSVLFSLCFSYINIMFGIGLFIFLFIAFAVALILDFEHGAKKSIKSYIKKNKYTDTFENTIKENTITRKNNNKVLTHEFENIEDVVFSDNEVFMYDKKMKTYIIFQKKHMNYNMLEFIKEKFNVRTVKDKDLENEELDDKKKKKIMFFMILLLILTLVTPFIAGSTINSILFKSDIISTTDKINNMYIFWLFAPIPALSIILGINYKKKGLKTFGNILVGFIILIYLLLVGSAVLLPTYDIDYKEINKYKDIVSIKLPKDGQLEYKELKNDDKNISNYEVYIAYYNAKNAKKTVNEIKNDEAWFTADELKTYMKIFTSVDQNYIDADYYSIYNKTTDEYNCLPTDDGKYEIYVMKFHRDKNTLTIEKFKYNYKNKE